jgi:hypothetical protein
MKIKINFQNLDKLVNKMQAVEVPWKSLDKLSNLELQQLESIEGLEKGLDDIVIDENGLMSLGGEPVILFIKETWNTVDMLKYDPGGKGRIRFHILGDCSTLEQMKRKKRYDRYAFTKNQSGEFSVYAKKEKYSKDNIKLNTKLAVCINCLLKLEYEGSGRDGRGRPSSKTFENKENFSIKEFFKNYVQTIITKPKYSDVSYPEPGYNSAFHKIKKEIKQKRKYNCEECSVDLNLLAYRKLLHCHHVDGNTGNNSYKNLQALCICCHANYGKHLIKPKHMKLMHDECLDIRKKQGCTT